MSTGRRNSRVLNARLAGAQRATRAVVGVLVVAGCSAGGGGDPAERAPTVVVSSYASATAGHGAPPVAVRDDAAVVAGALPTEVPGYTKDAEPPRDVVVRLCPGVVERLVSGTVQASAMWRGSGAEAGRWVYAVAVLDPKEAPPDRLLATLMPQACPERDDSGATYVHDRQPYERDGWTGALDTSLATTAAGERYYEATYLISKGDALVNVVAGRERLDAATPFDPAVDSMASQFTI